MQTEPCKQKRALAWILKLFLEEEGANYTIVFNFGIYEDINQRKFHVNHTRIVYFMHLLHQSYNGNLYFPLTSQSREKIAIAVLVNLQLTLHYLGKQLLDVIHRISSSRSRLSFDRRHVLTHFSRKHPAR